MTPPQDEASYWQGYNAAKENLRMILAQVPGELRLAAVGKWLQPSAWTTPGNPQYQSALRDAESESWDEPGRAAETPGQHIHDDDGTVEGCPGRFPDTEGNTE